MLHSSFGIGVRNGYDNMSFISMIVSTDSKSKSRATSVAFRLISIARFISSSMLELYLPSSGAYGTSGPSPLRLCANS